MVNDVVEKPKSRLERGKLPKTRWKGANLPNQHYNGNKKLTINEELLKRLAYIQCTIEEMAGVLGMTRLGLGRHINKDPQLKAVMDKARETGKASLRRMQWRSASVGNVQSQIWLGKQYLGQVDKVDHSGLLELQAVR